MAVVVVVARTGNGSRILGERFSLRATSSSVSRRATVSSGELAIRRDRRLRGYANRCGMETGDVAGLGAPADVLAQSCL